MKKIDKKYYNDFCQSWQRYAKTNFPSGFPVTSTNLRKVYAEARDSHEFGSAIYTVLRTCLTGELSSKWDSYLTWSKQTSEAIRKLAYKVLTAEKLTKQMAKDCGIILCK